jgi:hypothetical protein
VLTLLGVGVATLIHLHEEGPDAETSVTGYALSLALAGALALAAFTRIGRPVTVVDGRRTASVRGLGLAGLVLMVLFDLAPASWLGLVMVWVAATAAGVLLVRCSRSPDWTSRHVAAFAFGGILERTLIGFLAPTPPGADSAGKLVQNAVVLLLVVGLGVLLDRVLRSRTRDPVPEDEARPAQ